MIKIGIAHKRQKIQFYNFHILFFVHLLVVRLWGVVRMMLDGERTIFRLIASAIIRCEEPQEKRRQETDTNA